MYFFKISHFNLQHDSEIYSKNIDHKKEITLDSESKDYSQRLFSKIILKDYSQRLFSKIILKDYSYCKEPELVKINFSYDTQKKEKRKTLRARLPGSFFGLLFWALSNDKL
jgi:Asp-tRNA(Asn)/Glu-tRNA(Gln) amidotransferase B subunit